MDVFLSKVTQQAMNYAIRSGITITATYAIRQSSRLLKNVDGSEHEELQTLQGRLRSKIQIISPAIDMIELIAARGNTSLESAVSLTKSIRWDIQSLGQRLAKAASAEETSRKVAQKDLSRPGGQNDAELKLIIQDIKKLLNRLEDAVPLINLAITTSGASLSTNLPSTVSPSRLLQASTFLTAGDTQYFISPGQATQVGPTFTLSVYMLFAGHVRPQDEEGIRETTWKEVIHKARVKIRRVPMSTMFPSSTDPEGKPRQSHIPAEARGDEYAYQILIVEDLDDDRVHTFDENDAQPESFEGVAAAGMREIIPIHQISKIFYADTGKILNIGTEGETNNPVLLLKRDVNAFPPRRMVDSQEGGYDDFEYDEDEKDEDDGHNGDNAKDSTQSQIDAQLFGEDEFPDPLQEFSLNDSIPDEWRLPPGLDPEWVAFEVYNEVEDSESETETEPSSSPKPTPRSKSVDAQITEPLSSLNLNTPDRSSRPSPTSQHQISLPPQPSTSTVSNPLFNNIRTSLSLLETLLRLTSLQQFQQQSHLSITDELLNFFLEESSTTGAGGDEQHRQRLRAEARRKVGWDPYDESPLKRRGEDYQAQAGYSSSPARWDTTIREDDYPLSSPSDKRHSSFQIRSRNHTPETSSNNGYRVSASPSPSSRAKSAERRRTSGVGTGPTALRRQFPTDTSLRKGSPLARPTTGQTDEGLGTSPGSLYPNSKRNSGGDNQEGEQPREKDAET